MAEIGNMVIGLKSKNGEALLFERGTTCNKQEYIIVADKNLGVKKGYAVNKELKEQANVAAMIPVEKGDYLIWVEHKVSDLHIRGKILKRNFIELSVATVEDFLHSDIKMYGHETVNVKLSDFYSTIGGDMESLLDDLANIVGDKVMANGERAVKAALLGMKEKDNIIPRYVKI